MAKQLLNKITNKTVIFSNDFENKLRDLNNRNCHDEIRVEIANQLGLPALQKVSINMFICRGKLQSRWLNAMSVPKVFLNL